MQTKMMFVVWISTMLLIASTSRFPALDHIRPSASMADQQKAAQDLIVRVLGVQQASHFKAVLIEKNDQELTDTYNIKSNGTMVTVSGTSGVAIAMGFYDFLKTSCHCQYTWAGQQLKLPKLFPVILEPGTTVTTNDRFRYYQNVCTSSYTFAFWNWTHWERHIDWMAMNGINLPLAFNGQEAIFQRVYMNMGISTEELGGFFGGPAFLAWARMGNIQGWGGPLPQSWNDSQLALQHRILDRMRSLGMIPVLPAFAGHVPGAVRRLFPNASVSRSGGWYGFNSTYSRKCEAGIHIRDYAAKQWSGLISGYYAPRWKLFLDTLINCLKTGQPFNQTSYNIAAFEDIEKPFTFDTSQYTVDPVGDSVEIAANLFYKYLMVMQSKFYNLLYLVNYQKSAEKTLQIFVKKNWESERNQMLCR